MQSRVESLLESSINILIGYIVAVLSQLLIFSIFNGKTGVLRIEVMGDKDEYTSW